MNFKEWLLSEEIYPQNKTATVFHRTCSRCGVNQSIDSVAGILTSDFKAGSRQGCHYGCGLYTTFALQSQFIGGMTSKYGHAVIKFKVTNLDNYLIFQTSVAKAIHGKDYKLSDQLKKFGVLDKVSPDTNLPEIEQELLYKPFSGELAKNFYEKNKWIENTLKGIIVRGRNDGFVLLKYMPVQDATITMLGYIVAEDNDFEKMRELQANDGWIKSTNVAAMKSIYNLPQEKRSQYKFPSGQFIIDKLLKADPKVYEFLVKKYKTEIEKEIENYDNVEYLLQKATAKDKMAELIIKYKKELSDEDVPELLRYAKDKDRIAELIINKQPKLLSNINVFNLLLWAKDKDKIAELLQKETDNINQLSDKIFQDLLEKAFVTAKDQMAKTIIKYKKELSQNNVNDLLANSIDKERIAELIINKQPKLLSNINIVWNLLHRANDKEKIAELLQRETDNISKLSDNYVRDLLDLATDKPKMAQILNKYHQNKTPRIQKLIDNYLQ